MTGRVKAIASPVTSRPAEALTLTGGAGLLAAYLTDTVGSQLAAAIGMALTALPAAITWLVAHGGVKGIALAVWRGE